MDPVALSAFLLVFGTSLEYTCTRVVLVHVYTYVARVPVVVGSIPHQIAYFYRFFVFLYFFVIFFQIYQKKNGKLQ